MTDLEAYPLIPDYGKRCMQYFKVGDKVRVGPAYQQGGDYKPDEFVGEWFILRPIGRKDYAITKTKESGYLEAIVHVSRLEPIRG